MTTQAKRIFASANLAAADDAPLYMRIKKIIREAMDSGMLQKGDAMPGERDIATLLDVSRVTVRKAFSELVDDGILIQKRGSGTYVGGPLVKVEQPLSRLTSFTEDMKLRGLSTQSQWLSRQVEFATPEEALKLSLSPQEKVSRLKRLRFANDVPMAIEAATIPERFLNDPSVVSTSLYAVLGSQGYKPVRALQRLHAVALEADEAKLLCVPTHSPALLIERISFLSDGRPVEFTLSHYRGDTYDFVAELSLAPEAAS